MKKVSIIELISLLFIFLFLYTAVSTIVNYDSFKLHLAQSTLTKDHAYLLSRLIPALELMTVGLLSYSPTRITGLIMSLKMTIIFTAHSAYMLMNHEHLSSGYIRILSVCSWKQHILFGCILMAVAMAATVLQLRNIEPVKNRHDPGLLALNPEILQRSETNAQQRYE